MKNPPPSSHIPTPVIEIDPQQIYRDAKLRNKLRHEEEKRVAEAHRLLALLDSQDIPAE